MRIAALNAFDAVYRSGAMRIAALNASYPVNHSA